MELGDVDHTQMLSAAAHTIGVSGLFRVEELAHSRRTAVWRVSDGSQSYVLKIYCASDGNTWAREASALEAVGSSLAPRLLGVCADPQLAVMSDLGPSFSVADAVLGDDAPAAAATVTAWAGALGRLHRTSAEVTASYRNTLTRRAPQQSVRDRSRALGEAAHQLQLLAAGLGITVTEDVVTRLTQLPSAFAAQMDVLSPGDTCPDNNLVRGEHVTFLDFEFAEVRHLAWDVAYLRVPWPTCWCAWRLPSEVAEQALERYRQHLRPTVPYVDSSEFDHDVDLATFGWCLESAGMFLEGALSKAAAQESTKRRPADARWS